MTSVDGVDIEDVEDVENVVVDVDVEADEDVVDEDVLLALELR